MLKKILLWIAQWSDEGYLSATSILIDVVQSLRYLAPSHLAKSARSIRPVYAGNQSQSMEVDGWVQDCDLLLYDQEYVAIVIRDWR